MVQKIELPFNSTMQAAQKSPGNTRRGLALTFLVYAAASFVLSNLLRTTTELNRLEILLISYLPISILTLWFALKVVRYTPQALGMGTRSPWWPYLLGAVFAGLSLLIIWLSVLMIQGTSFYWNRDLHWLPLFLMLVGFICQGFMEEFLFRSILQTQVALSRGLVFAMFLNAGIFGLAHVSNQGASVISVSNTILIGLVFSLMYYYHDTIWFVSGFHSAWNFILGPVLGISVSGFELPTSVMVTNLDSSRRLWTGGAYGFEAGFLVTLLSIILISLYSYLISKKYGQKMA